MQNTSAVIIENNLKAQRLFFASHQTRDVSFRLQQLKRLKKTILQYEGKIVEALYSDLHKSPEEAFLTEISIVVSELNNHIKHLRDWAKLHKKPSPLQVFPSKSCVLYEPLGVNCSENQQPTSSSTHKPPNVWASQRTSRLPTRWLQIPYD